MIADSTASTLRRDNFTFSEITVSEKLNKILTQVKPSHYKAIEAIRSPCMLDPIIESNSKLTLIEGIEITSPKILDLSISNQNEINKKNITHAINHSVKQFYHRTFLNGEKLSPKIFKEFSDNLYKKFIDMDDYAKNNFKEIKNIISLAMDEGFSDYRSYYKNEGAKFKSNKKAENAFLPATQIRTKNGKIFELLNTLNNEQTNSLLNQFQINKSGKVVLGEGDYGKVRLARDMETGEIVAVKKFISSTEASIEIEQLENLGKGKHLLRILDYAHLDHKSYIFMNFAGIDNGISTAKKLMELEFKHPLEAKEKIKLYASQYLTALAELHAQGIYHRDIKPENIMHSSEKIHIVDYGFATQDIKNFIASTPDYLPPELQRDISQYSAEKHDIFGLGLSLLTLKLGNYPDLIRNNHLEIYFSDEANSISLRFNQGKCLGLTYSHYVQGKTLDEVIVKMLDDNPHTRPSAHQLLQLPYFND